MLLRRRAGLGGQAAAAGGLPRAATASTGTSPGCTLVDLQYSDVRPDKGLYHRLVARGRDGAAARPTTRSDAAMTDPPEDTRAYFRGECLAQYADRGRRRLLGLGDLRRARPRLAAAGPDAGAAARHAGARRRAARPRAPTADATCSTRSAPRRAARVGTSVDDGGTHGAGRGQPAARSTRLRGRATPRRSTRRPARPRPPTPPSARQASTPTSTRSSTRSTRCWRRTPRSSSRAFVQKGGQ